MSLQLICCGCKTTSFSWKRSLYCFDISSLFILLVFIYFSTNFDLHIHIISCKHKYNLFLFIPGTRKFQFQAIEKIFKPGTLPVFARRVNKAFRTNAWNVVMSGFLHDDNEDGFINVRCVCLCVCVCLSCPVNHPCCFSKLGA